MGIATATGMTVEEFLSLPDDGMDRELIEGELREKPMTVRNRHHSECLMRTGRFLTEWAEQHGKWRVLGGEAGFVLQRDPDTTVGIDIAVVAAEVMQRQGDETTLVAGVPIVAIEILSPSDTQQEIHEKTRVYLNRGVAAVWLIDPDDHTVRVYRKSSSVQMFSDQQPIAEQPELPGFEVDVGRLFGPT